MFQHMVHCSLITTSDQCERQMWFVCVGLWIISPWVLCNLLFSTLYNWPHMHTRTLQFTLCPNICTHECCHYINAAVYDGQHIHCKPWEQCHSLAFSLRITLFPQVYIGVVPSIQGSIYYLTFQHPPLVLHLFLNWGKKPYIQHMCHWRQHASINYNFIIIDAKIVAYIMEYLYWPDFESTLQHDFNCRPTDMHMGLWVLVSSEIMNCHIIPFITSFLSMSELMPPFPGDITL